MTSKRIFQQLISPTTRLSKCQCENSSWMSRKTVTQRPIDFLSTFIIKQTFNLVFNSKSNEDPLLKFKNKKGKRKKENICCMHYLVMKMDL